MNSIAAQSYFGVIKCQAAATSPSLESKLPVKEEPAVSLSSGKSNLFASVPYILHFL